MKAIRFGTKVIRTLIRDRMYYPDRLIVDTFSMVSRCGILLILYAYVFRHNSGNIQGTEFPVIAWSIFLYFTFSVLRLRDISKVIMQDVQSGSVELLLCKPVSYLAYRMWWQVGSGLYSFLLLTFLGSAALFLVVGIPLPLTEVIFFPTLIVTILLGGLLSLFLYSIVGLLSFWIEDISPIFWMVDKSVMILGGSYLPIALFPDIMRKVALYSPFGASQFITHTVYANWSENWLSMLSLQLFWLVATGFIVLGIFSKAKHKVSVNGG